MTQEEKQLLLKDLCARIPYDTLVQLNPGAYNKPETCLLCGIDGEEVYLNVDSDPFRINNIKPYLRPMSSMTEEEKKKLKEETCPNGTGLFNEHYLICPVNHYGEYISFEFMSDIINWLNAHHFDYRGLIEKGLALEAPEGMYKTE